MTLPVVEFRASARPRLAGASEWDLLLCLARRQLGAETIGRARALVGDGIDWAVLLDLADRHRLLPLLREHLRILGRGVVPAPVADLLDRAFLASAARSLLLVSELGEITGILAARGVRVLAYKGPVVALAAYGNPVLRPMRDLDLVIHPRDFRRVERVLVARGYRRITGVLWRPLQRRLEYQCCFARDRDGALVELHWTLMPRNICVPVGIDDLWERRAEMRVAGRAVPCLSHEERLLSLIVHGAKHRWARLEWVACVAELLRSRAPDWDTLLRRAGQWRARRMLRLSLLVADALLLPPVPDEILRDARNDRQAEALAEASLRQLVLGLPGSDDDDDGLRRFHLRAQDGASGRIRYHVLTPMIHAWRGAARLSTMFAPDGV